MPRLPTCRLCPRPWPSARERSAQLRSPLARSIRRQTPGGTVSRFALQRLPRLAASARASASSLPKIPISRAKVAMSSWRVMRSSHALRCPSP